MNGLDYHHVCPTVEFQALVTWKNVIQTQLKDDRKHPLLKTFSARSNCNADKVLDWTREINLHVNDM